MLNVVVSRHPAMAQPFRAPRRQSESLQAVDLVSPSRRQSTSQTSHTTAPSQGTQPQSSGTPSQSRRKKEDNLWPVNEESAFIALLEEEKKARVAGEVMIQGEQRFTRMCMKLNQQFHDVDHTYIRKEWKQIRSKESNLRSLCKDVLGKVYNATAAKTVSFMSDHSREIRTHIGAACCRA